MNFVHRIALLGIASSVAAASVAFAAPFQNTPAPADNAAATQAPHTLPDPQKQTARLSRKLQLTPEQAAKIEPILHNRQQQMQQIRSDTSLSPHDLHRKMRAMKQATDSQLQAVLTASQLQQYQQMQQQAMQKHRNSKSATPAAGAAEDHGGSSSSG